MNAKQKTAPDVKSDLNAIALLKADHRKVTGLFRQFEAASSDEEKSSLARQICNELIVHALIEEEIFYPACREAGVEESAMDEAQVEHDGAKVLIAELLRQQPDRPFYDARVTVLSEYIKHHVGEEEEPGRGIFAKARAAKLDMNALGKRLQARKEELMTQAEAGQLRPSATPSLEFDLNNRDRQEQQTMARQYDRDRDDQGRFTSEDDDQRNRGYASRSSGRDRDEQGRFMSDDDRADSRSFRSERDYGDYRSSRGGQEGRGSGWYGDPEGHSRASERGWESRGRQGSSSRYSEEDDYRSSRAGQEGRGRGWSGDPEGHSRASEMGWEGRGRQGSSSRESEDDDRGGRGRQHGGWFGDSRRHAEAARRGWNDR